MDGTDRNRARRTRARCVACICLAAACGRGDAPPPQPDEAPASASSDTATLEAPAVSGFGQDSVLLEARRPMGRVVAYVSRGEQRIYVEQEHRDRVQGVFDAHISVSTGHWRIPLPGDDPAEPLIPGVPEREFEEFGLVEWGPGAPRVGDFRVVLGVPAQVGLELDCTPFERARPVPRGGPWTVTVAQDGYGVTREDLVFVAALPLVDGGCRPTGDSVVAVMWVVPEQAAAAR